MPVHALWNLHALDPLEAAAAVIEAMRSGCGYERWDFYRTDDEDPLAEEVGDGFRLSTHSRAPLRFIDRDSKSPHIYPERVAARALRMRW